MNKYESKTTYIEIGTFKKSAYDEKYRNEVENNLNVIGQQGWELVSCTPLNQGQGWTGLLICIFKRKITQKEKKK